MATKPVTTSAANNSAAQEGKTFVAFFTREGTKGPKVEIFKGVSGKPKAPTFSGKIGGKRVAMWLQKGSKGAFFNVKGDKVEGSNNAEDLGTANIGTLGNGVPVLVIDFKNADGTKTPVFASISKKLSNDELVTFGLNAAKQAEKALAKAAAPAKA